MTPAPKNCDFCDRDDFEDQIIYQNDLFYVIYPRRPIFKYHLMLVPREHTETFDELDAESAAGLVKLVGKVKKALHTDELLGYNIFSNNGDESIGQSVPHFHLHMFIRYQDEEVSPYKIMNDPSLHDKLSPEKRADYQALLEQKLCAAS